MFSGSWLFLIILFLLVVALANGLFSIPISSPSGVSTSGEQLELFQPNPPKAEHCQDRGGLGAFVFGSENAILHSVLQSVLEQRFADSPLVLYGDQGTGKTALSHALLVQWRLKHSGLKSLHTNGIDFAREHARAVHTHSLPSFRKKYFSFDLLVIDDTQVLKTRTSAQQTLSLIIDTFREQCHMLVVCTNELPLESSGLDARLASRLMGGLQVQIATHGNTAREELVRLLSDQYGVVLDNATQKSLLNEVGPAGPRLKTVPEMRSAVLRLRAQADLEARDICRADVERFFADDANKTTLSLRDIATAVSRHLNIRLLDMKSSSRRRYVVRARSIAIYLCRLHANKSYSEIGQYFGHRDHSTIMHAFNKTKSALASDSSIRLVVEEVNTRLSAKLNPGAIT
ncbi:MAG: ATP-binding protein [Planctomycetaceae bacterium]|nr:ATP-binding protein [Planctomycetaceae bacterium]MBT5597130.1 ATP-binding protein [Planctomycetaceae bacterium]MBT5885712.1 ATP-binding protein [Planctomycetaceae bacterium]